MGYGNERDTLPSETTGAASADPAAQPRGFDDLTPVQQDQVRTLYKYGDPLSWLYQVDQAGAILGRRALVPVILGRLARQVQSYPEAAGNVFTAIDLMLGMIERWEAEDAEAGQRNA